MQGSQLIVPPVETRQRRQRLVDWLQPRSPLASWTRLACAIASATGPRGRDHADYNAQGYAIVVAHMLPQVDALIERRAPDLSCLRLADAQCSRNSPLIALSSAGLINLQ